MALDSGKLLPVIFFDDGPFVDNQKCLLPSSYEIKDGTWAKCEFADNAGFVVCRVFHRNTLKNCCQLTNSVGTVADLEGKILNVLYPLMCKEELRIISIDVSIDITEDFFIKGKEAVSDKVLRERISGHGILESIRVFHLLVGSTVRSSTLKKSGIEAVHIQCCAGIEYQNGTLFTLDEFTEIHVVDVHLTSTSLNHTVRTPFYMHGFERVWCTLDDLLAIVKLQDEQNLQTNYIRLPLNILLVGTAGCGKSCFVETFMKENKCNLLRITKNDVLAQYHSESISSIVQKFQAAERLHSMKITKSPIVILIEDLDMLCPEVRPNITNDTINSVHISAKLLEMVDNLYEKKLNIVCIATTSKPEKICATARRSTRFQREIAIDLLTESDRKKLFSEMLRNSEIKPELKETLKSTLLDFVGRQTQGYVAADLALLVRNIEQSLLRKQVMNVEETIKDIISNVKSTSIRATDVTVYETEQDFSSLGGMQTLKHKLEVSILAGLNYQSAFNRFGLHLPKGVLLYGPPGCGKTRIAKCLAKEANMRFISTSGAEVYSPYIGCAEKFISKIFDTARKNAPCVIFLDEIDTLAGRRAIQSNGSSDVHIRILSTLLTEMDGIVGTSSATNGDKYILVVAASNRPDMIDDALLRPGRFDKLIYVPEPDLESRCSILKLHAQRMPFADDINIQKIAENTVTFSGADMCNLCNEAAMRAFQRNMDANEITSEDFAYALRIQKSSLCHGQINTYLQFQKKCTR